MGSVTVKFAGICAGVCVALTTSLANEPFVAAVDEASHVYVADWVASSNEFQNFRQVFSGYRSEGDYPYTRHIAVGDFNGDGHDDIVTGRRMYHDVVAMQLLLNDGSNNFIFDRIVTYSGGYSEWAMDGCAGDFNHDGIDDFTAGGNSGTMRTWTSDGASGFNYVYLSGLTGLSRGTDCADVDRDGHLDIVRTSYGNGDTYIHFGNGDGTFQGQVYVFDAGGDPYGLCAADFDNDGLIDIIANTGVSGDTYFYQGNGDGTFQAGTYVASLDFGNHGAFDAYDYDGDGNIDIVATDHTWDRLRFYRSNGDGTFTNSVTVGTLSADTMAVSAPPLPPVAGTPVASVAPVTQTITTNTAASWDGSGSSDPGGLLVSNRWVFGDGDASGWAPIAATVTSHVYATEGRYLASYQVLDNDTNGAVDAAEVIAAGFAPDVVTNSVTLGEADAYCGSWPLNLPVSNIITDAEGLADQSWTVSNVIDVTFEDGSAAHWSPMAGTWAVQSNEVISGDWSYRQSHTTADRTRNFFNQWIDGDFIYEVDFMMVGGAGQETILNVCGPSWYNTYDIIIRGRGYNDLRIDRITDNGTNVRYNRYLGFALSNNVPYHAEVHRIGSELAVHINGAWVGSTYDGTWKGGRVGIGDFDTDVIFDNVKVHLVGESDTVTGTLPGEGTYSALLTASDAARQSTNANLQIVCENDGTPPAADAGGPYVQDETGASNGWWTFQLDGSGSTDADVSTNDLTFTWDLGTDTFDGTDLDASPWHRSIGVYQNDELVIPDQGGWGSSYAVTRRTVERTKGAVFQARVRSTGNSMVGFFHTSGFTHTHMPYAVYFNGAYLRIYEDGANRRFIAYLNTGNYYDVKIELKETQGARYYYKGAGSETWFQIYDSDHSSATDLRMGITLDSGTAYVDNFVQHIPGMKPAWSVYGAGTRNIDLIVTDPAGNADTNSALVTTLAGTPPVADPGGEYVFDEFTGNASNEAWLISLQATNSYDNESDIIEYRWCLGTNTFDDMVESRSYWVHHAAAGFVNGALSIPGYNNTWGARYAVTVDTWERARNLPFEARIKHAGTGYGHAMVGWRNPSAGTYHFNSLTYAVYFADGQLHVYEDGASRGHLSNYTKDVWYDVRIVLKESAGARYYVRQTGAPTWTLLYDSNYSSRSVMGYGLDVHSSTFLIDDVVDYRAGETVTGRCYLKGTNDIALVITDQALNSSTNTTRLILLGNEPPVADAGPPQTQVESNAVDRVWTFDFDASASSDDHGIYLYQWDWDYDGTFELSGDTGVAPSHTWGDPGVYTAAVRVVDHAGQMDTNSTTVTVNIGPPPVPDHGGPYAFDEFTGTASGAAWTLALDGSGSTDADSSIVEHRWDMGRDTFDDERLLDHKWVRSSDALISNGVLRIGAAGVAGHYAYSRDVFTRVRGLRAEARVRTSNWNTESVFGFKQDNTATAWSDWAYGLALDNGQFACWEYGSWVNMGVGYGQGEWYDLRVELKEAAGARYYYKPAASNDWVLLRDTTSQSATTFRRGFLQWTGNTTFEADDYGECAAGSNINYRLYVDRLGANDVVLSVYDQALQVSTSATVVVCLTNDPPVAAFHPSDLTLTELQAVGGVWQVPYNATSSSDDHSILGYEWDFDYNPAQGFQPDANTSPTLVRQFTTPGTSHVALRVTDELLQQAIATGQVTRLIGTPPVAVVPTNMTVEVGWAVEFDGSASTDDSGVVRYAWDFGDGSHGSGARPLHVYRVVTNVILRLRVHDGVGQASNWATSHVAVVVSTGPTADAGGPYTAAAGGPPVYFDGSGSTDNGAPNVVQGIARYNWDIDIGTDSDSDTIPDNDIDYVVSNPFHTYTAEGVYTARLEVIDGPGAASSQDVLVTIVPDLPPDVICVPWRGDPTLYHEAINGEAVTLKAVVRDAGSLTHQWLFGDGSTTTVSSVADKYAVETTHTYTGVPGQPFAATLRVWDSAGQMGEDTYLVKLGDTNDATRADIAIDMGLWWLHKDQNKSGGHWQSVYGGYYCSADSSALLALQMNGHALLGDPSEDPYVETLRLGFEDLFGRLYVDSIGPQAHGDPDTNGNGIGIRANSTHNGYENGMVMDAIAASRALLAVAPSGPANVEHRFFLDILTDMVDEYAWGQTDTGGGRGGWRYSMNYGSSDNSGAQWGAIGLLAAQDIFGINIPQFVKDENLIWLNASRNGANYGYSDPNPTWQYYSTTPSALVQMALDDIATTNGLWIATEDEMRATWPIESFGSKLYYAYYAFVKAMRLAKPLPVTVMHADGFNWYEDPVEGIRVKITGQQNANGSWDAYAQYNSGYYLYQTMSTAWGVAMLTPSLFSAPPVAVIDAPPRWPYGTNVLLGASRSYHPDQTREIIKYEWDFDGDGIYTLVTVDPVDPGAAFMMPDPNPGEDGDSTPVTVRLRVTDDADPAVRNEDTIQILFSDGPFAPFAIPGGPYNGYAEVPTAFDGSASWDLDVLDAIQTYQWDFTSDGAPDVVSNTPMASWTWDKVGYYAAGLRVIDDGTSNGGQSLTSEWVFATVTITPPPEFPLPIAIDFTNTLWTIGGDNIWTGQIVRTHDGIDAGGSPLLDDRESAWFETTLHGPGTLSFWWKASCEQDWDWLRFYMDGDLWRGISGQTGWQTVTVEVAEAAHTVRWGYYKDKSEKAGRDQVFVDQIVWAADPSALSGFPYWLYEHNIAGDPAVLFSQSGPDDPIAYGFEYAFGLDPNVSNDTVLLSILLLDRVPVVDIPLQDPATTPFISVFVEGTTDLRTGLWNILLDPTNPPARPPDRDWYRTPGPPGPYYFRLRAEEK